MEHKQVSSSHIHSIGYDKESKTLEIKYYTGKTFRYKGVAEPTYNNLMKSESKGKYVHSFIRGNFDWEEV